MKRATFVAISLAITIVLMMAALPVAAQSFLASQRGRPAAQTAPTVVPTAAISLSPTADLSGIADDTETPGELLVAYIVFTVVGLCVAVTVFLVWKTRPSRRAANLNQDSGGKPQTGA